MKPTPNLWPLGIIAAFVIFISGTISLVVMASSHKAELVSDNYYEQEIKYQNRIDSLGRAQRLGSVASVRLDAANGRIAISLPPAQVRGGVTGRIQLYRPSAAGADRALALAPNANGLQFVDLRSLLPGLWRMRVSWTADGQEYWIERGFTNSPVWPGTIPRH
jgi:hypothetical protein